MKRTVIIPQIKIIQRKSIIGATRSQRATIRALGLRRINHSVEQEDCPEIRGMIKKVNHLVGVENVPTC